MLHPSGLLRWPDFGESVKLRRPVPSLAEYYRRGLRVDVEPGTRWTKSGHRPRDGDRGSRLCVPPPPETWPATSRRCWAVAPTCTAQGLRDDPGPQAHPAKLLFEKYFLWKARNGYVRLP